MVTDPLHTFVQQKFSLLNTMLDDLLEACVTDDCSDRQDRIARIVEYTNHRGLHQTLNDLQILFLSEQNYVR